MLISAALIRPAPQHRVRLKSQKARLRRNYEQLGNESFLEAGATTRTLRIAAHAGRYTPPDSPVIADAIQANVAMMKGATKTTIMSTFNYFLSHLWYGNHGSINMADVIGCL